VICYNLLETSHDKLNAVSSFPHSYVGIADDGARKFPLQSERYVSDQSIDRICPCTSHLGSHTNDRTFQHGVVRAWSLSEFVVYGPGIKSIISVRCLLSFETDQPESDNMSNYKNSIRPSSSSCFPWEKLNSLQFATAKEFCPVCAKLLGKLLNAKWRVGGRTFLRYHLLFALPLIGDGFPIGQVIATALKK
jgi:hypothetical protein